MRFLKTIGKVLVDIYAAYSKFIHNIFQDELGDFAEVIILIIVAALIVKFVASVAFSTKSRG